MKLAAAKFLYGDLFAMGGLFESNLHLVSNLRNIFPLLNLFGAGGGGRLKQPLLSVFYWSPKNGKMVTSLDRRNFVSVACTATKKQARSVFFSKFPFHVLEDCREAKKRDKDLARPPQSWHTCGFNEISAYVTRDFDDKIA